MSEIILCVFEGEKTEPQIFNSLKKIIFPENEKFDFLCYGTDIYDLYKQLEKDPYLDVFELIREKNKDTRQEIKRVNISMVYLFFDYDPQACQNCDKIIPKLLEKFNNETEDGKLFISYPMVEALKDCHIERLLCCDRCSFPIRDIRSYKRMVNERICDKHLRYFNQYDEKDWRRVIDGNIKKAQCIVNDVYERPSIDNAKSITQEMIYSNQYEKFIEPYKSVAILSAFPFFIIDYFTKEYIEAHLL